MHFLESDLRLTSNWNFSTNGLNTRLGIQTYFFLLVQRKQNTKKKKFFNRFYCATRYVTRCATVLCSVVNFVVQFSDSLTIVNS